MAALDPFSATLTHDDILEEYRRLGIRPIGGGSGEGDPPADDDPKDDTDDNPDKDIDDNKDLGDAGKKAMKAEREARRTAEAASVAADKALKAAEKELRAIQKRLKDLEDADLSESQKVAKERDDLAERVKGLATKAREANGREAVRGAALKLGADAKRLDVIWKIVRSDVAYDDEDEPNNVQAVLAALKADHPEEFKPVIGKGDGGAGGGGKPKQGDFMRAAYQNSRGSGG